MTDTTATLVSGERTHLLRARLDRNQQGVRIARNVLEAGWLTTLHERTFEQFLYNTTEHELVLTAENPFLKPAAKDLLDERGLMRVGCTWSPGAVLASVLHVPHMSDDRPARPAPNDYSLIPPSSWCGAIVTAVSIRKRSELGSVANEHLTGKIEVSVRLHIPFSVGDVLVIRDFPVTVAGVFDFADADLVLDSDAADRLRLPATDTVTIPVAVHDVPARFSVTSRGTGPYALITQQPLAGKDRTPGQAIGPAHVHALRAGALRANLRELVTLKSDDLVGRAALQQALHGDGAFPQPGKSESLHILLCHLAALGLASTVVPRRDGFGIQLRVMSDSDSHAYSSGPISKPGTLHNKTFMPTTGGLFCETVFGPRRSADRRLRFGHVDLPDPIIPYIFRMRSSDSQASPLAGLLELTEHQLAALIRHQLRVGDNGALVPLETTDVSPVTGALAVEQLLSLKPEWSSLQSYFVHRTVLLIPPDLRPLIPLDSGNWATSDLNDHYRQLIVHAGRLRKLQQLNVPEKILLHQRFELQRSADRLFANLLLPAEEREYESNRPLRDLIDMLTFTCGPNTCKRLDYSARARAIIRENLPPDTVLVPRGTMETLYIPAAGPVLLSRDLESPGDPACFVVMRAHMHDELAIALPPRQFSALFSKADLIPECIVTRPLSPDAVAEAEKHVGSVTTAPPHTVSWLESENAPDLALRFRDAALAGTPLDLDFPAGILLTGLSSAV